MADEANHKRWQPGQVVLRREVLNDGRAWMTAPVVVVQDEPALLATYLPEGTPFHFPEGDWPSADGRHPWHGRGRWEGNGLLMLQRPGESYAVWVFWHGAVREFRGWYVNLQEPFRRTGEGYDTQDLELDIVVSIDGSWQWKDDELLDERVREGRFTAAQITAIRAVGAAVVRELDSGRRWWSDDWASWTPDPAW